MYYPSRQALGDQLAARLMQFKQKECIIVCLKPSSLLACVELAAHLHAYIYLQCYEIVKDPYNITRTLGAVIPSGDFVLNPEINDGEYEFILANFMGQVQQGKREAISKVNKNPFVDRNVDIHVANGRDVILFADILEGTLEVEIAKRILKPIASVSMNGVGGNISSEVSLKFQMETSSSTYMDVLSSGTFDDDHYFEQLDQYTEEQKFNLASNISLYWA